MADGTVDNNSKIPAISDVCIGFAGAGVLPSGQYSRPAPATEGFRNSPFQKELETANPGFSQKTGILEGVDLGLKVKARFPNFLRNFSAALATGGSTDVGLFYVAGGGAYSFGGSDVAINMLAGGRFSSEIGHLYSDATLTWTHPIQNVEIEVGAGARFSADSSNNISSPLVLGLLSLTLYLNASKLAADKPEQ